MKLYVDVKNSITLSINELGYAYPVNTGLVEMARMLKGDELHKEIAESAILDFLEGRKLHIGQLGGAPFASFEGAPHPYAGKSVEEVIAELGEPEII